MSKRRCFYCKKCSKVGSPPPPSRRLTRFAARRSHHFTTALCARLGIKTKPPEWINQLADKGASIGVSLGIINAPAHARRLSGSTAREHNQTGPPSPLRRGGAKAQARRSAEPTRTRAEGGAIANRDRADTPEQVAFGCV